MSIGRLQWISQEPRSLENDEMYWGIVNAESQTVTFTNCQSDFDTKMYLIDSVGNYIQSQSTNSCDGDDCWDSNYCSTSLRETFTMDPLAVGTYTLMVTPWSSGGNYEVEMHCGSYNHTHSVTNGTNANYTMSTTSTWATDNGTLQDLGWSPNITLGECQGDCDWDSDCENGLICFQNNAYDAPPGCSGTPSQYMDYCYDPLWDGFATTEDEMSYTLSPSYAPTAEPSMSTGSRNDEDVSEALSGVHFEVTSTEYFDGESMDIGWIEYSHCKEGNNINNYNPDYSMDELIHLAQYAVTVKIMPSSDVPGLSETANYAVMADRCSNPIFALNYGYTMSWTVEESSAPVITGLANMDNWIGTDTAKSLMWSSCYGDDTFGAEPSTLDHGYVYHACGNTGGLHIRHDEEDRCWFDWYTYTGHNISVWLGFDANKERNCEFEYTMEDSLIDHNSTNGTSSSTFSWIRDMKWNWLNDLTNLVPDEIPFNLWVVVVTVVSVFLAYSFFRCCCWRKKKKSYKRVGYEDELESSDTDCDVMEPMNI